MLSARIQVISNVVGLILLCAIGLIAFNTSRELNQRQSSFETKYSSALERLHLSESNSSALEAKFSDFCNKFLSDINLLIENHAKALTRIEALEKSLSTAGDNAAAISVEPKLEAAEGGQLHTYNVEIPQDLKKKAEQLEAHLAFQIWILMNY
jgi:hypothetical protein